jgi:hypothetical protein
MKRVRRSSSVQAELLGVFEVVVEPSKMHLVAAVSQSAKSDRKLSFFPSKPRLRRCSAEVSLQVRSASHRRDRLWRSIDHRVQVGRIIGRHSPACIGDMRLLVRLSS